MWGILSSFMLNGSDICSYSFFSPRERNANHSVEATRAPLRIFWNHEDIAVRDRVESRRKAVTPATTNAADEAHAAMFLAR